MSLFQTFGAGNAAGYVSLTDSESVWETPQTQNFSCSNLSSERALDFRSPTKQTRCRIVIKGRFLIERSHVFTTQIVLMFLRPFPPKRRLRDWQVLAVIGIVLTTFMLPALVDSAYAAVGSGGEAPCR